MQPRYIGEIAYMAVSAFALIQVRTELDHARELRGQITVPRSTRSTP